jgi:6-pyruvoyltetrahydropterin/6-carboxytetrahydropterin synthase
MKYSVKKIFEIAYAHRLLNYNGKCENLHGHNAKIEVIIETKKLNDEDMVMDFVKLKEKVKKWLDENLDHTVILSKKDPLVNVLKKYDQKLFITNQNPTAEIIAKIILEELKKMSINAKIVRFWETDTSMAEVKED